MISRPRLVYGVLFVVWGMIVVWQIAEHRWVRKSARSALINRSRDITATLGLVIRSQRRFGGVVLQERIEPALKELVKSGELGSVALLNAAGDVVAPDVVVVVADTVVADGVVVVDFTVVGAGTVVRATVVVVDSVVVVASGLA